MRGRSSGRCGIAAIMKVGVIGVGGINRTHNFMEFIVAGASAVQIGTANFYDPGLAGRLVADLERVIEGEGVESVADLVGTLRFGIERPRVGSPSAVE